MSDSEDLHQPHDKLFIQGFGDPVNAAALLQTQLPGELAAEIDWKSLKREQGSFIDSQFRSSQTDLLFTAQLAGQRCALYLLFEHQSTPDPWMALRLLRYMVRIWEAFIAKKTNQPLPVILPVVLAQNGTRWEVAQQFRDLMDLPTHLEAPLRTFVPDFRFALMQLAEMEFGALPGTASGILILRVMKAERMSDLLNEVVWDESLITQVPREFYERVLRYILAADIDKKDLMERIEALKDPATRHSAMSVAQQLRQEGRQEGALGSLRDSVLDALELRFDSVPEGLREAVTALEDVEQLRALLRRAIQAETLEQFASAL